MSASLTVASGLGGIFPIGFGLIPQEGSRCIECICDWTNDLSFSLGMAQARLYGLESVIQAVFIDNSDNPNPVTVSAGATQQIVVCPPAAQGVFPLFLSAMAGVSISTTANAPVSTGLWFLNTPATPAVWTARSAIDLNFLASPAIDPRVTFTRASQASMFDANGNMIVVGNDVARMDTDPVTLQPKGLRIEGARSNLLLNTAAPLVTQSVTTAATNYVLSFYDTGSITWSGSAAGTLTGTGAFPARVQVPIPAAAGALTLTVTGNCLNAQLEAVTNINSGASSWIPTVATAASRAADLATMAIPGPVQSSAGALLAQAVMSDQIAGVNGGLASISDGTTSNLAMLWQQSNASNLFGETISSGVTNLPVGGGVPARTIGTMNSAAISWNGPAVVRAVNGVAAGASINANGNPVNLNTLWIGRRDTGGVNSAYGWIERVQYWPQSFSQAKLLALTA